MTKVTMSSRSTTTQVVTDWTKVFLRQATETYTSSVTFMKQLTVVAVSTIIYLKNAFPEDNYTVETFDGLKICILKQKCNDDLAQFLSNAMVQAFEAFEKKYLHQLAVCFYDGDCKLDNLIEYHIFEYSYKPDGMSMTINSKGRDNVSKSVTITLDDVREKTMELIRACVVTQDAHRLPLPGACHMGVRLYYNEDAPEGYQAPGFIAGADAEDPLGHTYGALSKLGRVETPFHKLVLRSYFKDPTPSNEPIPSENPPVMTQSPEDFHSVAREQRGAAECSPRVRCVCNNYESEAPGVLLTCIYCGRLQHATCYGVAGAARHCCVACSDADGARAPTDARLAAVAPDKRQSLAIFRRSLELCARARRGRVAASALRDQLGVSRLSAARLMKLLQSSGVIERPSQAGLDTASKIDYNQLKITTKQFFQTAEDNIVDRLVAETFNSQTSQSNPVEDILSPLEKVSLQNASQLGRVIENPEATPNSDDPTMKQYREALILVEKNENIEKAIDVVSGMDKLNKRAVKRKDGDKELGTGARSKRARIR